MEAADSDEAITLLAIQRTLGGDSSAFSTVVNQYTGALYSLVRSYGKSAEDAEEDVQEIFLRAYRSLSSFDLSRRFKPWLFQIALNHLRSVRRLRLRRQSHAEFVEMDGQTIEEITPDQSSPPDHTVIERLADRDVARALDTLPKNWRDVFILRQMQGLSGKEAAQILGLPEETLRTYLFRARKALQKYLIKRGWD